MKSCPYCRIEVGGDLVKCPLCQSKIKGREEAPSFPTRNILIIQSFVYKLQSFIVWSLMIIALGLDFMFHLRPFPGFTFHWSLILLMWMLAFEFGIMRLFKKGFSSSRILTIFVLIVLTMLSVTAYYFGMLSYVLDWVAPVTLIGTMIANFVLAMIDKSGNSMVYLLSNLIVGILPYVSLYLLGRDCPMAWVVALMVSVIFFVGAIIFKGREVVSEIQRRLNV